MPSRPALAAASLVAIALPTAGTVGAAGLLGSVGLLGTAVAQTTPPAPKPPHVLTLDSDGRLARLGPVRVGTRSSSLVRAYRAFGKPTSTSGKGNVRRVRWAKAGISVVSATFGGCRRTRCRTDELKIQTARLTGPRWQTEKGLKVGDPLDRVLELYPRAKADRTGALTIAKARTPFGEGDQSIITVLLDGGVVKTLSVFVGDAGE